MAFCKALWKSSKDGPFVRAGPTWSRTQGRGQVPEGSADCHPSGRKNVYTYLHVTALIMPSNYFPNQSPHLLQREASLVLASIRAFPELCSAPGKRPLEIRDVSLHQMCHTSPAFLLPSLWGWGVPPSPPGCSLLL